MSTATRKQNDIFHRWIGQRCTSQIVLGSSAAPAAAGSVALFQQHRDDELRLELGRLRGHCQRAEARAVGSGAARLTSHANGTDASGSDYLSTLLRVFPLEPAGSDSSDDEEGDDSESGKALQSRIVGRLANNFGLRRLLASRAHQRLMREQVGTDQQNEDIGEEELQEALAEEEAEVCEHFASCLDENGRLIFRRFSRLRWASTWRPLSWFHARRLMRR